MEQFAARPPAYGRLASILDPRSHAEVEITEKKKTGAFAAAPCLIADSGCPLPVQSDCADDSRRPQRLDESSRSRSGRHVSCAARSLPNLAGQRRPAVPPEDRAFYSDRGRTCSPPFHVGVLVQKPKGRTQYPAPAARALRPRAPNFVPTHGPPESVAAPILKGAAAIAGSYSPKVSHESIKLLAKPTTLNR